jgi:hypothetical protein
VAEPGNDAEGLATAIGKVTDQAVGLVREEIELAKAEVSAKVSRFGKGVFVAAAAGVFGLVGLLFLLEALAWLLWKLIFSGDDYWGGFFLTAVLLFIAAGVSGFLAYKWINKNADPTPRMAIDEAKLIRDTVAATADGKDSPAGPKLDRESIEADAAQRDAVKTKKESDKAQAKAAKAKAKADKAAAKAQEKLAKKAKKNS